LKAAAKSGRIGRAWGARVDVLRAVGPSYALHHRREKARESTLGKLAVERFYRDAWAEAAAELGCELRDLESGFLEIRRDGATTRVWRQLTVLDEAVSLRLALDKTTVHRLLAERALPVPEYLEYHYSDLDTAGRFLAGAGSPCVVKPASGASGGAAVTGFVTDELALARASLSAARHDTRLLIERQVPGHMYRLLFLDGELLDVVRRVAPHVRGDGRSSILELIMAENERRLAASRPRALLTVDLDCLLALSATGRELASVPPRGEAVQVKSASSENGEDENETVREFGAEVVAESAEAVGAVGLRLAGVDVVTPDIDRPLRAAGGAIIEVNGTPGFQYHYEVADRAGATRVALPILRRALEEAAVRQAYAPAEPR
jgi:D-alanine-D-alanine ligase-like ATP-grasp enzyme